MWWVLLATLAAFDVEAKVLYSNAGPVVPAVGSADLAVIPIGDCMTYEFDIYITQWCAQSWCAIFHVGGDDSTTQQARQRMPGLWLNRNAPNDKKIYFAWSTLTNGNSVQAPVIPGLALNTVFKIKIFVSQSVYSMSVNGVTMYTVTGAGAAHCINGQTCNGEKIPEAGLPLKIGQDARNGYGAMSGTVSNIMIKSCDPKITFKELYSNKGPVVPAVGSADLAIIPIGDCMQYEFDIYITSWCAQSWCAIFHVGGDDSHAQQARQRMPGVWLNRNAPNDKKIYFAWSTLTNGNYVQAPAVPGLALNTLFRIKIFVSQTMYSLKINGASMVTLGASAAAHCINGQTCNGYAIPEAGLPLKIGQDARNGYDAMSGTVSNILISSCDPVAASLNAAVEPVAPLADGSCPDGYEIESSGKSCVFFCCGKEDCEKKRTMLS